MFGLFKQSDALQAGLFFGKFSMGMIACYNFVTATNSQDQGHYCLNMALNVVSALMLQNRIPRTWQFATAGINLLLMVDAMISMSDSNNSFGLNAIDAMISVSTAVALMSDNPWSIDNYPYYGKF